MAAPLDIRVLGPLEVRRGDTLLHLGGTKQRTVLAVLLLSPNEVVSVDHLIQAVWGEDAAPTASRTLQVYLSKLRNVLSPHRDPASEFITTVAPGYRVAVGNESMDLLRFEEAVDEARAFAAVGDANHAVQLYREALSMWRGSLLSDLAGTSRAIDLEADRLEMTRIAAHTDTIEAELALGHHGEVLPEIDRLVRLNPLDERLRGQLMIALYRSGRHTEALDSYREVRVLLDEELGLEPGSELQQLEEKILMHDPDLLETSLAPPGTTVTIQRGSRPLSSAWLQGREDRHDLDRAVTTIGRSSDRTVVLQNETVSRRHAEIRRVGPRFALVDVGSMNGVSVNGRALLEHDLEDGDLIHIGTVAFYFHVEA